MPAERTHKRTEQEDNQFVWSLEPTKQPESSYPIDLSDLPPLVDPPASGEFILFSPNEESASPRKQPHSKKKPENHIPRPPNAFILFRSSFIKSQAVSTEVETNHSTLSKIIGLTWQNLPEAERRVWHTKAKEALEEHKRKFPKYAFRPVQTKTGRGAGEKRKVREVEPKDPTRCAKIAQLLVEGKKGHELDLAIQEFDKHHVPQIVARFEAPITERSYRRSSSAPIPDTEHSRASQGFLQPSSPRKSKSQRSLSARLYTPEPSLTTTPNHIDASFTSGVDVDVSSPLLKREPSFDFSTFSFNNVASPMPSYTPCDPLTMPSISPFDQPLCESIAYTPALSIDTSCIDANVSWQQCTSPMASDFLDSPPCPPTSSPSFDSFNPFDIDAQAIPPHTPTHHTTHTHITEKHLFDYTQFPIYHHQGAGIGMGIHESHLAHADSNTTAISPFALHHHHHSNIPMVDIDLDFGSFMASAQQY